MCVEVDAADEDGRLGVDDHGGGAGAGIERAPEQEIGDQRRRPGRGQVDPPKSGRCARMTDGTRPCLTRLSPRKRTSQPAASFRAPRSANFQFRLTGSERSSHRRERLASAAMMSSEHADGAPAGIRAAPPSPASKERGLAGASCDPSGRDERGGLDRVERDERKPDIPAAPNGIDVGWVGPHSGRNRPIVQGGSSGLVTAAGRRRASLSEGGHEDRGSPRRSPDGRRRWCVCPTPRSGILRC